MTQFYKLSTEKIDQVIAADLPKSAHKLWLWVCRLDPFSDRQIHLTWEKAKEALGMSKSTFYRSLAQLVNSGLLISQKIAGFCVSFKNGTQNPELGNQSQNWDSSLYTDLQTLSEGPEEKNEKESKAYDQKINTNKPFKENVVETQVKPEKSQVHPKTRPQSSIPSQEKFSAAHRTEKRTEKPLGFGWLPEGPWNIDGKLDPNFVDWLAKKWLAQYGKDLPTQQANVLLHFKKDPDNLVIRWQQYQSEFGHRVSNAQILMAQGVTVKSETQALLITHQRAVTEPLPSELKPVAEPEPVHLKPVTALVEPEPPNTPSNNSSPAPSAPPQPDPSTEPGDRLTLDDGSGQKQVLKVFRAADRPAPETTPEQRQKFRQTLQNLRQAILQGRHQSVSSSPPAPAPSRLQQLNQWLRDPNLRQRAIAIAQGAVDMGYDPQTDQIIQAEEF